LFGGDLVGDKLDNVALLDTVVIQCLFGVQDEPSVQQPLRFLRNVGFLNRIKATCSICGCKNLMGLRGLAISSYRLWLRVLILILIKDYSCRTYVYFINIIRLGTTQHIITNLSQSSKLSYVCVKFLAVGLCSLAWLKKGNGCQKIL